MEVNIKTCYIICGVSRDFNHKAHGISRLYVKQILKIIILYLLIKYIYDEVFFKSINIAIFSFIYFYNMIKL